MITRLEDEQMVHGVTTGNMSTIKKKLTAALGPDKIKTLTSGSEDLITGASGHVDCVDKLLGELSDNNSKIDAAISMVAKLQSKAEERGVESAVPDTRMHIAHPSLVVRMFELQAGIWTSSPSSRLPPPCTYLLSSNCPRAQSPEPPAILHPPAIPAYCLPPTSAPSAEP